jgi:hypothetical protein
MYKKNKLGFYSRRWIENDNGNLLAIYNYTGAETFRRLRTLT